MNLVCTYYKFYKKTVGTHCLMMIKPDRQSPRTQRDQLDTLFIFVRFEILDASLQKDMIYPLAS